MTRLHAGQERAVAAALAESHAEYPAFVHVFPDAVRRRRALLAFFTVTAHDGIVHGEVHGVLDGDRVLAAAVWMPPGAFPWSARRKARATPGLLRVLAAYPSAFRTFTRYGANAERAHPDYAHWYLVVLGVRPDAQRLGLGTRLIEPVLRQADDEGVACYLESSDHANVAYYARFGFELVDDSLALVPNGPTHVAMRRPITVL